MVQKVEKFIKIDRRVKLHVIAKEMAISKDSARKIIVDQLGMRKISARWVPPLLTLSTNTGECSFHNKILTSWKVIKFFFLWW